MRGAGATDWTPPNDGQESNVERFCFCLFLVFRRHRRVNGLTEASNLATAAAPPPAGAVHCFCPPAPPVDRD
eukprot:scaffold23202_cov118-Isochrysis_galbana.AAC.4